MGKNPTFQHISGSGKPRILVLKAKRAWDSLGATTYTVTTATEAEGTSFTIVSSSTVNDSIVTSVANTFTVGMRINVAGHTGSVPDINGKRTVLQILSTTEAKIDVDITTGGTGGTARQTPDFRLVRVGMRIASRLVTAGSSDREVYAKVKTVDDILNVITISDDGWVYGQPTNGQAFSVDGWVIDLPYSEELLETFSPDLLEHNLYRSRIVSKFFGWKYRASVDYSTRILADTLIDMEPALNIERDDKIVLIPRADKPGYNYNCVYGGDISVARYGQSPGHKGFIVSFKGTENVAWPIPRSGYGFQTGEAYGIGL